MRPSMRSGSRALARWRRIPGPPNDPVKARLLRLYEALESRFGPQRWWPARAAYEVAAGAILVQFTSWANAKRALDALRAARLLTPRGLAGAGEEELTGLVRPAGTFRLKSRRLRQFTTWLLDRFGGSFRQMRRLPLAALRAELLGVPGIGPETADTILLYAAGRPMFIVDEYTRRVLDRHGLVPRGLPYESVRAFLESHLPSDPALFGEYHALLVAVGKAHCRSEPDCQRCPLRFDLSKLTPARSSSVPPRGRLDGPSNDLKTRRRPGRPAPGPQGGRRRRRSPAPDPARPSP